MDYVDCREQLEWLRMRINVCGRRDKEMLILRGRNPERLIAWLSSYIVMQSEHECFQQKKYIHKTSNAYFLEYMIQ